jgi:hypothetical protein
VRRRGGVLVGGSAVAGWPVARFSRRALGGSPEGTGGRRDGGLTEETA